MDDVDFKSMHRDAMENLAAIEQIVSTTRKLADFAGHYMSEEQKEEEEDDGDERLPKDKPTPEENTKLYGRSEVMADDSHDTNTVDRSDKKDRKKLAVIKMMRMK